jgi:hypothetical protein
VVTRREYKRRRKALKRARAQGRTVGNTACHGVKLRGEEEEKEFMEGGRAGGQLIGGKERGGEGEAEISSSWSSSSGYDLDNWQEDIARLRNTSDPGVMAALRRGRKVLEDLGNYDTHNLFLAL